MQAGKSEDLLQTWFDEGMWISCESIDNGLKMCKAPRVNSQNKNVSQSDIDDLELSTTFEWLDGIENDDSIVVPLGEGETFSTETKDEIMTVESDKSEDSILLQNDPDEESVDSKSGLEDEDNGRLLPLFISHILRCEQYKKCFKLGSFVFKFVHIFGTVVGTQVTNKKNMLVLDDGTAQIMCYMKDSVNEFVAEGADDELDVDSEFYEFFKFVKEETLECLYILPTFDKINIGDKVLIAGDVSLYKGNHYIFIEDIMRPRGNSMHIRFMKDIFEKYDTGFYDF